MNQSSSQSQSIFLLFLNHFTTHMNGFFDFFIIYFLINNIKTRLLQHYLSKDMCFELLLLECISMFDKGNVWEIIVLMWGKGLGAVEEMGGMFHALIILITV